MIAEPLTSAAFAPFGTVFGSHAAPPDAAGDAPAGFRAFRVPAGSGVVLHPGVWHGAPLALDGPGAALVLLPLGTGTDDTQITRFPENPIRIEV